MLTQEGLKAGIKLGAIKAFLSYSKKYEIRHISLGEEKPFSTAICGEQTDADVGDIDSDLCHLVKWCQICERIYPKVKTPSRYREVK